MSYSNDLYSQLKMLDKIIMSNNPTVQDMLEQTIVLAEVSKEEEDTTDKPQFYGPQVGPLEQMFHDINNLRVRLSQLEQQMQNMIYNNRGQIYPGTGTWSTSTSDISQTWRGTPSTNQITGAYWGPTISEYDFTNTGYSYNVTYPSADELNSLISGGYTSGAVTEALKSDPESFDLVDPDTGTVMTVKYK